MTGVYFWTYFCCMLFSKLEGKLFAVFCIIQHLECGRPFFFSLRGEHHVPGTSHNTSSDDKSIPGTPKRKYQP